MCEFSAQQKIHYNGQANSNEWDCECECECESRQRQMSRRGNAGGGEPMHKHDENVLQFAVKFARCVYFQIMRKLFAYAPNKGAGWGMLWKGREKWETRLLSRRMRTSWQQPAAQQLSIYFCFFASIVLRIRAKCNFSYLHNCRQSADSADSSK